MNKLILALGAAFALSACTDQGPTALTGDRLDGAPDTGSEPVAAQQESASQNCYEVAVEQPADPRDDKKIAGTAIGAVVGGAIGHEIDDSDFATAAGAAAGAYAGRVAQDRYQERNTETVTEVRCE
jgi:uncharacterized protein YcfJ